MVIGRPVLNKNFVRVRRASPMRYTKFRMAARGKNRLVRGQTPTGDWETQSVVIPKKSWHTKSAERLLEKEFGVQKGARIHWMHAMPE